MSIEPDNILNSKQQIYGNIREKKSMRFVQLEISAGGDILLAAEVSIFPEINRSHAILS